VLEQQQVETAMNQQSSETSARTVAWSKGEGTRVR